MKPLRVDITTAATAEPVTLAQAKTHCQIEGSDSDTDLQGYLDAAVAAVERLLRMQIMTATYEVGFHDFPSDNRGPLLLPRRPVTAITTVQYHDTNGTQQTLGSSLWDYVNATPYGQVIPAWNQLWPETRNQPGAENVTLTFDAGYSDAADVPKGIINSIKMLTRDLFDNRNSHQDPDQVLTANPNYKMLLGVHMVPNV